MVMLYIQVNYLTVWLQASVSGEHTFFVTCKDECELWITEVFERGISGNTRTTKESVMVKVTKQTGLNEWNK